MFSKASIQKGLLYLQKLRLAAANGHLKDLKRCIQKGADLECRNDVSEITENISLKISNI